MILFVFWWLKLIGITIAGEAFCGMEEHKHTDACTNSDTECTITEHIHTSTCYSNLSADVEDEECWEKTFKNVVLVRSSSKNVLAIAKTQIGYKESSSNFIIDDNGIRRGYTRYGQWFGNTHGEWSTMFTSFCLRYAGIDSVPISAGAESLRILWQQRDLFKSPSNYIPIEGDLVFLDTNSNGTVDATAIVSAVSENSITVIQGDLEDKVGEIDYRFDSGIIKGYGISSISSTVTVIGNAYSSISDSSSTIAHTVTYNTSIFNSGSFFILYTMDSSGNYYAIDANGNSIRIYIDSGGNVTTDLQNTASLLWAFEYCGTENTSPTYYIYNSAYGRYLHPHYNSASDNGSTLTGKWETAIIPNSNGVKLKGARQQNGYARLNGSRFDASSSTSGSVFFFAKTPDRCTVWLDGTNGGLRSLVGSPDTAFHVNEGDIIKLPTEWQSPNKYEYVIRGWYDVVNRKYYNAGDEVTITKNTVFYADWVSASYDVGVFNDKVVDTVSTNGFITTHVFDYNVLFNLLSVNPTVNVTSTSHSETWNIVQNGNLSTGDPSLDFIFIDYDANGDISYPGNRDTHNNGHDDATLGIYTQQLVEILFGTDTEVLGKHYLGQGDYLFQYDSNPNGKHYGYYYYDSMLHAASYNQSLQRFYVYNYLERTSDTARDGGYADFLPFNSPYVNTNGQTVGTYTYNGDYGEYANGTLHYQYDAKNESEGSTPNGVNTNYWYGMSIELDFFLPDNVATGGNKDIFGNDMHFHFSGDDDVWILIDGKFVLDLGGIHGIVEGDINFSTGVITRQGNIIGNLSDFGIGSGEHTMQFFYLERGSSKSNCELYFNLAPRYDFQIRKEDVLTSQALNGAEFSIFMDIDCTVPAVLWNSKEDYENGQASTNTFKVTDGLADMWGMTSGRIYYIKETKPPDKEGYSLSNGIICLTLDHKGYASYTVEIVDDGINAVSPGYTVHGLKVDVEKQEAYIVVTNAEDWVKEVTSVEISKKWNDSINHDSDLPVFYLTVKDPDGTVRRIRQIKLGKDNDWKYTWTNLPKYYVDATGNQIEAIEYGVEEAFYPGYSSDIVKIDKTQSGDIAWAEAYQFENGEIYVLKTSYGCLATDSSGVLTWMTDTEAAKNSPAALWTATVNSDGSVEFTNRNGYKIQLSYRGGTTSSSIFTGTTDNNNTKMYYKQVTGQGIRIYHRLSWSTSTIFYIGSSKLAYNGIHAADESGGVIFTPLVQKQDEILVTDGTFVYVSTNTPLDTSNTTSVTVNKVWDLGILLEDYYKTYQIPIKLFADGYDTGLEGYLTLQNGWTLTFEGLPYKDSDGKVISYTIEELWQQSGWEILYGSMSHSSGSPGKYSTTITNRNLAGYGVKLPETGSFSHVPFTLVGAVMCFSSFIGGCILRHKKERRTK